LDEFIQFVSSLDPVWVYVTIFALAYIENIFPPSPSDIVVVFGGSLVALGHGHFLVALLAGTTGSTLGFLTMFLIGKWFGKTVVESGKLRFLSLGSVHRAEQWFNRYGYGLIVINRFLSGTRAVISFFAGLSNLDVTKALILSFVSSLVWNGVLVYSGFVLGRNWHKIGLYLSTYTQAVTAVVALVVVILLVRYVFARNNNAT